MRIQHVRNGPARRRHPVRASPPSARRRPTFGVRWFSVLAVLAAGCGGGDSNSIDVRPAATYGRAVVHGRVLLAGEPPVMRPLEVKPCHEGMAPVMDESIVAAADGGLANVVVSLEGATPSDAQGMAEPALVDQRECKYVPRVVAVQTRQPLTIRSSDPWPHNVHYQPAKNPAANPTFNGAGEEKAMFYRQPEPEPFRLKCDIHPWMTAYVAVFDHPFFAVTGADGQFTIPKVPAGSYTLVAWHERLGPLRQAVTVGADGAVDADLTYKAPQ